MIDGQPSNHPAPTPAAHGTATPGHARDEALQEQVRTAAAHGTALRIVGSDSKAFYGRATDTSGDTAGETLSLADYRGIVHYAPTELVLTAHAGTPLAEIEAALAAEGQMLGFEPPHFAPTATLGGTVACALSGPRRPYAGAVRDFVLGVRLLTGKGEILHFGGEVMKNVAGYDIARLMAGALGTLGVLLDISLKVLPRPAVELTVVQEQNDAARVIETMNRWAGQPLPLSATAHDGRRLYLRLSGTADGVAAAQSRLGGELLDETALFWQGLREHTLAFFDTDLPLWRLSLPPAAPPLTLDGDTLLDWGGAQRWLRSDAPVAQIRDAVSAAGGHASRFRGGDRHGEVFHPLPAPLANVHRRLKQAFDPAGVFNPGRLYAEF